MQKKQAADDITDRIVEVEWGLTSLQIRVDKYKQLIKPTIGKAAIAA